MINQWWWRQHTYTDCAAPFTPCSQTTLGSILSSTTAPIISSSTFPEFSNMATELESLTTRLLHDGERLTGSQDLVCGPWGTRAHRLIHWPHLPSPCVESWSPLSVWSGPSFSGERASTGLRLPDLAVKSHVSRKHQHKWRQRTQLVDPIVHAIPNQPRNQKTKKIPSNQLVENTKLHKKHTHTHIAWVPINNKETSIKANKQGGWNPHSTRNKNKKKIKIFRE